MELQKLVTPSGVSKLALLLLNRNFEETENRRVVRRKVNCSRRRSKLALPGVTGNLMYKLKDLLGLYVKELYNFYECPQMSKLTKYNCQYGTNISNGTEIADISCQ